MRLSIKTTTVEVARLGAAFLAVFCSVQTFAQEASFVEHNATSFLRSQAPESNCSDKQTKTEIFGDSPDSLGGSSGAWGDSVAEANAEAELFRREYSNLKLRFEALGLTLFDARTELTQQRLLKCVQDLNLASQRNHVLGDRLTALSEAILYHLRIGNVDGSAQSRSGLEAELRASRELFGQPAKVVDVGVPVTVGLCGGAVIEYKEELSLLVTNFGSALGAKIGMPLLVMRGNAIVGNALVVNVRERISGAVLDENSVRSNDVQVGDQIKVAAFGSRF